MSIKYTLNLDIQSKSENIIELYVRGLYFTLSKVMLINSFKYEIFSLTIIKQKGGTES